MHPLQRLDFPTRVAKRAQYEAFEFTLTPAGVVVRNGSHADPSDHEYLVEIADHVPASCQCPADEHYEWACKHRVAVAIRRPLLEAAIIGTDQQAVADGGHVESTPASLSDFEVEDEDCSECIGDFPCWECVRTGRKELPD